MIENLHLEQLMPKELANLPNRLAAMPPLKYQHLMKWIKPIDEKYPFSIHPNILLAMLLGMGVTVLVSMTHVAWRIYQVRSQIKGFKPMTQWFQTDGQGNFLQQNLKITPDQLMKIVHFIQNPYTSVTQKLDAIELSVSKASETGKVPVAPPLPLVHKTAAAEEAKTQAKSQGQITNKKIPEVSCQTILKNS